MLTKYILHIGSTDYELQDDDLKNWADIRCSYKRSSYDGAVRSFTSKFEFVSRAYELLMEVYLRERFNALASLEVLTMNDIWEYDSRFECPLDFSTVEWENGVFSINAVDNSLAALINANKGTKYEFVVGADIRTDATLNFDRLPMMESLTYEITGGSQYEDCADLAMTLGKGELPYIGIVGSEISVNGSIDWNDDQTDDPSSRLFKAVRDIDVTLEYEIAYRNDYGNAGTFIGVAVRRNGQFVSGVADGNTVMAQPHNEYLESVGSFGDSGELNTRFPSPTAKQYATVNGIVWEAKYNGRGYVWSNTGKTPVEFATVSAAGKIRLTLKEGDEVLVNSSFPMSNQSNAQIRIVRSEFTFGWTSVGTPVAIDVLTPTNTGRSLLRRIAGNHLNVDIDISGHDTRLASTYILAAESVRGIQGARLYSSFSEFCEWMSAVFGYVYYIGEAAPSRFRAAVMECGQYEWSPWSYIDEMYTGKPDTADIVYIEQHGRFFYREKNTSRIYSRWEGWPEYNDTATGLARLDTLFRISELGGTRLYYFEASASGNAMPPVLYDGEEANIGNNVQTVHFVHRSEVLNRDAGVRKIGQCTGLKYTVDSSAIYSTVTVGYDKKDYESINGRDEFNFSNTYSTGCSVSDRTLQLISKYRADSYGIEFAVQKRGEETTDTTSDKDVFFLLCEENGGSLVPDRSTAIKNTLSDRVFNGAFSPMDCLAANAGYICLQSDVVRLAFASSTGNSDIEIDGVPMASDIALDTPLATVGTVEFTTNDTDIEGNINDIIEVSDGGVVYRGFIKEVDVRYAREEAVKYKLIVKDIVP